LRQQLHAQRLDPVVQIGQALFHAPETLFILSKSTIDALESFEHLAPHLLQPDHGDGDGCQMRAALSFQLPASRCQLPKLPADPLRPAS
jgi:hypothetical protein